MSFLDSGRSGRDESKQGDNTPGLLETHPEDSNDVTSVEQASSPVGDGKTTVTPIDATLYLVGSISYEEPRYLKPALKLGITKRVLVDTKDRFAERRDIEDDSVRKIEATDLKDEDNLDQELTRHGIHPKPGDLFLAGKDETVRTVFELSALYKTAPYTLNPQYKAYDKIAEREAIAAGGNGVLQPEYIIVDSEINEDIRKAERKIKESQTDPRHKGWMMKTPKESGGDGIKRVTNVTEVRNALEAICAYNPTFLLEEYIDHERSDEFAIQGVVQTTATLYSNSTNSNDKPLLRALANIATKESALPIPGNGGYYKMVQLPGEDDAKGKRTAHDEASQQKPAGLWNVISCDKNGALLGSLNEVPLSQDEDATAQRLQKPEYRFYAIALKHITRTHSDFRIIRSGDDDILWERISDVNNITNEPAVIIKPHEGGYKIIRGVTVQQGDSEAEHLFALYPKNDRPLSLTLMPHPTKDGKAIVSPNDRPGHDPRPAIEASIPAASQAGDHAARIVAKRLDAHSDNSFIIKKADLSQSSAPQHSIGASLAMIGASLAVHGLGDFSRSSKEDLAFTECANLFREFTESGHAGENPYQTKFKALRAASKLALSTLKIRNGSFQIDLLQTKGAIPTVPHPQPETSSTIPSQQKQAAKKSSLEQVWVVATEASNTEAVTPVGSPILHASADSAKASAQSAESQHVPTVIFLEASPRLPASFVIGDTISPHLPPIEEAELQIYLRKPLVWQSNQKDQTQHIGYLLAKESEFLKAQQLRAAIKAGEPSESGLRRVIIMESALKDHPNRDCKVLLYGDTQAAVLQALCDITASRPTDLPSPLPTPFVSRKGSFSGQPLRIDATASKISPFLPLDAMKAASSGHAPTTKHRPRFRSTRNESGYIIKDGLLRRGMSRVGRMVVGVLSGGELRSSRVNEKQNTRSRPAPPFESTDEQGKPKGEFGFVTRTAAGTGMGLARGGDGLISSDTLRVPDVPAGQSSHSQSLSRSQFANLPIDASKSITPTSPNLENFLKRMEHPDRSPKSRHR